jgi:hypothetical protein
MVKSNEPGGAAVTVIFDPRRTCQTVPTTGLVLRDTKGIEHMAVVECESFTTVAVRVSGGTFCRGDAVEAECGNALTPAVVRRADSEPGGKWSLVLRWGQ